MKIFKIVGLLVNKKNIMFSNKKNPKKSNCLIHNQVSKVQLQILDHFKLIILDHIEINRNQKVQNSIMIKLSHLINLKPL